MVLAHRKRLEFGSQIFLNMDSQDLVMLPKPIFFGFGIDIKVFLFKVLSLSILVKIFHLVGHSPRFLKDDLCHKVFLSVNVKPTRAAMKLDF